MSTILVWGTFALAADPATQCQKKGTGERHNQFAELNLTPDQKTKLKALHEQGKVARTAQQEKSATLRLKIKDEFLKKTPDTMLLETYSVQSGQLATEATKARFDYLLQLKSVLTDEQFQKMASCHLANQSGAQCNKWGEDQGGKHCQMDGKMCPMNADSTGCKQKKTVQ